jgi:hypothetical protein
MHHYVRDVAFREDGHRAAAAHQAFAAIRNAVTGAFRLLGVPGIAAQLRAAGRDPYRLPFQLLGLVQLPPSPARDGSETTASRPASRALDGAIGLLRGRSGRRRDRSPSS